MIFNLPDNKENNDSQSKIIRLIVKQVADNSVVPFRQIFNIWFGESFPAREEVVPRSQWYQFHFSHLPAFINQRNTNGQKITWNYKLVSREIKLRLLSLTTPHAIGQQPHVIRTLPINLCHGRDRYQKPISYLNVYKRIYLNCWSVPHVIQVMFTMTC